MTLSFTDTHFVQNVSAGHALQIATDRALYQGMDPVEAKGIFERLSRDEDAREMFLDLFGIEVFVE